MIPLRIHTHMHTHSTQVGQKVSTLFSVINCKKVLKTARTVSDAIKLKFHFDPAFFPPLLPTNCLDFLHNHYICTREVMLPLVLIVRPGGSAHPKRSLSRPCT